MKSFVGGMVDIIEPRSSIEVSTRYDAAGLLSNVYEGAASCHGMQCHLSIVDRMELGASLVLVLFEWPSSANSARHRRFQ